MALIIAEISLKTCLDLVTDYKGILDMPTAKSIYRNPGPIFRPIYSLMRCPPVADDAPISRGQGLVNIS
jgi:hypothetical protein